MPRLALTGLTLAQFRSHAALRMSCDGRPVAIHGPNGAGKTNILEAISLLSPGRGLRRAGADEMARPGAPGWKVSALVETPGSSHEVETWVEDAGPRQVRIDGKASPQVALGRLLRVLWLVPSMDRLWIEGAEGRRRFLDRMTMSLTPDHAEAVLAYEKAMRERNRLLKEGVEDPGWYAALERQMAAHGADIMQNRLAALHRLATAQAGAETAFPAAELALEGPDGVALPETAEALADALARGRPRDLQAGRTLAGPHRADLVGVYAAKGIAARLCSTGEQKALLVSLVLANARALAEDFGAPPILLLDEVAAHLDADRRAALYDEIVALGAQAWMTGSGRELFEALGARAAYLHVTAADGLSRVEAT